MLGRGKGRLGIDDPGLLPQRYEEALEGPRIGEGRRGPCELEAALAIGLLQGGEIFAAKHPRERVHRKEEVAPCRGNPAAAVWGQRPAGHHTVDMDMVFQGLAPGMQHHRDAEFAPEPLGVPSERLQRGGCRLEQEAIEDARVALGQRVQGMGQGKHAVEVGDRKELAEARFDPAHFGERLALGTVPVLA